MPQPTLNNNIGTTPTPTTTGETNLSTTPVNTPETPLYTLGETSPLNTNASTYVGEPMVMSSSQANQEVAGYSQELSNALTNFQQQDIQFDEASYSDPMTEMFDQMFQTGNMMTKKVISNIQRNRQNRENEMKNQTEIYKRSLMGLGIQSGKAEYAPELLLGQMQEVENALQRNLTDLDMEESMALMEAQQAQQESNFRLLRERMEYVREIKREKENELINYYQRLQAQQGIAEITAQQAIGQFEGLRGEEREIFLEQLSRQSGVPIGSLAQAMVTERQRLDDEAFARAKARQGTSGSSSSIRFTSSQKSQLLSLPGMNAQLIDEIETFYGMYGAEGINAMPNLTDAQKQGVITTLWDEDTFDALGAATKVPSSVRGNIANRVDGMKRKEQKALAEELGLGGVKRRDRETAIKNTLAEIFPTEESQIIMDEYLNGELTVDEVNYIFSQLSEA